MGYYWSSGADPALGFGDLVTGLKKKGKGGKYFGYFEGVLARKTSRVK